MVLTVNGPVSKTAYRPCAYHATIPKTSDVKALFLKNYIIAETARFYSREISAEEVDIISPRTYITKAVLRNIRVDEMHRNFRRLEDYFSID